MDRTAFSSTTKIAADLSAGVVSSAELTEEYIQRIERYDDKVNAVVVRRFDEARAEAKAADTAMAAGRLLGPLHGLPITIKESYDLAGTPTTWGFPASADNIASTDSHVVRRLKSAGAHFLGKTNVPVGLADFQSYNDIYGTTGNPWDIERTPGGSSGGSAAALAAGFTALEAGSDIGGSIRNPAHYCGVYGHKPTWGVVSDLGHGLPGKSAPSDMSVCGPLARSAEDLALAIDLIAGPDTRIAHGWQLHLPRPKRTRLAEYRVALWPEANFAPVSSEVSSRVQGLADTLAKAGATVSDTARPSIDIGQSLEAYYALLWGVMGAGVSNATHAARNAEVDALDANDHGPRATIVRHSVQDHRTWLKQHHQRFRIREAWSAFFEDWDILICPQMATAAFPHDHTAPMARQVRIDGEVRPYFEQLNWSGLITVAHLPSTVFPTGPSDAGLPIGLQAVGREFDDLLTIDFCRLLAREIGGFQSPPGYD
jgi:amidase